MVLEAARALANQEAPPKPDVLHVVLVVPDIRLYTLLKNKAFLVQPPYANTKVHLHVMVNDKSDPMNEVDWRLRQGLVELGLTTAETVHFTYPDQVSLGWPEDTE